jgi:hypothetical protein
LIVYPIFGLVDHLFIEEWVDEFKLEGIRFELYQLCFGNILQRICLRSKIFESRNFVPVAGMQREFQCLICIRRVIKIENFHRHWRVVFSSSKLNTFSNFYLLKIIVILSRIEIFKTKIVLVKQFYKSHIELVTLTQFLCLGWI